MKKNFKLICLMLSVMMLFAAVPVVAVSYIEDVIDEHIRCCIDCCATEAELIWVMGELIYYDEVFLDGAIVIVPMSARCVSCGASSPRRTGSFCSVPPGSRDCFNTSMWECILTARCGARWMTSSTHRIGSTSYCSRR